MSLRDIGKKAMAIFRRNNVKKEQRCIVLQVLPTHPNNGCQEVMVEVGLDELLAQHHFCDPRICSVLSGLLKDPNRSDKASDVKLVPVISTDFLQSESVLSFLDMVRLVYMYPDLQKTRAILSRPFLLNGEKVVGRAFSFLQPQVTEERVFVEDSYNPPSTYVRVTELSLCKLHSSWPLNHFVPVRI